jgi:hypothetical protein
MTITTVRVRRTHWAERKALGRRREERLGRGKGRGKGRGRGRLWRKGRGREMIKGKVMLNKPQGKMISLVLLHLQLQKEMYEADSDTEG